MTDPSATPGGGDERPQDVRSSENRWVVGSGLVFGAVTSILLAGGGLLLSRPELVLMAAPILLVLVWAWLRRPSSDTATIVSASISRGGADSARYAVSIDTADPVDAVVVRLLGRGRTRHELVVSAADADRLSGEIPIVHSGPQEILRVDFSLVAAHGGYLTQPTAGIRSHRVIAPRTTPLRELPLPFRMVGLSGGHNSAKPGDGGEFRDVSQFAPGDRLRRIDWKVTARRAQQPGDLYVRRSFSTADATALIVVDSRDDVGELVTRRGSTAPPRDEPTSLDLAREAASSLASAYIKAGDRVGFHDLSGNNKIIAPGGGMRHLHRLLPAIARAQPIGAPSRRVRAPIVPAGVMVYVISTFLDGEAARMAALWRASGHRVVAVDSLPPAEHRALGREERAAMRIISMERQDRINSLRAVGVDVVTWRAAGGLSAESQLGIQSRVSRAPR